MMKRREFITLLGSAGGGVAITDNLDCLRICGRWWCA
jgi:hypothetical protein